MAKFAFAERLQRVDSGRSLLSRLLAVQKRSISPPSDTSGAALPARRDALHRRGERKHGRSEHLTLPRPKRLTAGEGGSASPPRAPEVNAAVAG
jgi:hypothetical protein